MTLITINVQNDSPSPQNFLYFMSAAQGGTAAGWYSTSLGTATLGNYAQSGAILTFILDFEYRAGVQQAHAQPVPGQQSGYISASQAVQLSTGDGKSTDTTTMTVNPLALSPAVPGTNVPANSFRIVTASYNGATAIYNAGTALRTSSGGVVLPTFIVASPNTTITIAPKPIFNLALGNAGTGIVVDPTSFSRLGVCDATFYTSFQAVYTASGTWQVTPGFDTMSMVSMSVAADALAFPEPGDTSIDGPAPSPTQIIVRL